MSEHESPEPKPETAEVVSAGETAVPAKPRRRRTTTKTNALPEVQVQALAQAPAEAAASGLEPLAPAQSPDGMAPTPAKPARARRPRKVAVDAAVDAVVGAAEPLAADGGAPQRPEQTSVEPGRTLEQASGQALAPEPGQTTAPTPADAEAPMEGAHDEAGNGPRERERGRRRRRRGKRDRDERSRATGADEDVGALADAASDRLPVDDPALSPAVALMPADAGELFAELLSGAFDADALVAPASGDAQTPEPVVAVEAPRRVLAPQADAPKLHKVLAQAGIGSRRDMEQWMQEGRVTVNGEPAHTGQRISFGDRVAVNGKPVKFRIAPPPPRVIAYHKPVGEVVTHDDPQHRPTVFRRLPRLPHGKWQSVGRLDINTEGLLLFTNSGELANQLMHPRFGVEREYAVRSLGELSVEQRQRLLDGVEVDGQRAGFVSIEDGGGEGVNRWYRVVISEGRNREVRKLFDAVGHAVSRLIRIRYGCVVLPRGLRRGVWVDLPEADVKALRRLTGTERAPAEGHARGGAGEGEGGARGKRGRRGGRARDGRRELAPDRGGDRGPRPDRSQRAEGEDDGPMHIPNPLQQTYDKRFIQQARKPQREYGDDGPIPNPLQQTYDKRALQRERMPQREYGDDGPIPNPLQQTYDKRFVQKEQRGRPGGGGGGGRGGRAARGGSGGGGGGSGGSMRQPDPMQTAVGYIGADALRGRGGKGKGGKRRTGKRGGPGGGGGAGSAGGRGR